jgi:acyl-CoA reductase-like NAD-dependent aldehyde dehydrogenase
MADSMSRPPIIATARLYLGGVFTPSESGRTYTVTDPAGAPLGRAARASRKDVRDAVVAARAAFAGWAATSAHRRGQVLYGVAELLDARAPQLVRDVGAAEGRDAAGAAAVVAAAVDRWIWYAGWTDKIAAVAGSVNPVPGGYLGYTLPEPVGVVGVVAPRRSSLLGLVSVLAPVLAAGCTAVVLAGEARPLPAVALAECLAVSDLPGGTVNILTGPVAEPALTLAAHGDVNALDLTGVLDRWHGVPLAGSVTQADGADLARALEVAAAENLKRVHRGGETDWAGEPDLARLLLACETKSVWQPVGT